MRKKLKSLSVLITEKKLRKVSSVYSALPQMLVILEFMTAEEYRDRSEREHIWFEVLEIGENSITAKLTQEPYYIPGLHTGDVGKYGFDEITDWIALYKEQRITPDNTYLINRS